MKRFLSPKEFAQAVGVSESSVKRWADEGLLDVARTAGGHRRLTLREAIRYIRKAGLPVVKPELLGIPELAAPAGPDQAGADVALLVAVSTGEAETARGIIMSQYLSGRSVADLCDGPLTGAMRQVGELWRHGAEGIFIEHRANDICAQCLHQLRTLVPPPAADAPVAIGGAVEGDPYTLPTLMVAAVLADAGWLAVNLGANLPMDALLAAVKEYQPSLVWLSCSVEQAAVEHARDIRKTLQEISKQGLRVIAGGRAWNPRQFQTDTPIATAGSMGEVAAYIEGLRAGAV